MHGTMIIISPSYESVARSSVSHNSHFNRFPAKYTDAGIKSTKKSVQSVNAVFAYIQLQVYEVFKRSRVHKNDVIGLANGHSLPVHGS